MGCLRPEAKKGKHHLLLRYFCWWRRRIPTFLTPSAPHTRGSKGFDLQIRVSFSSLHHGSPAPSARILCMPVICITHITCACVCTCPPPLFSPSSTCDFDVRKGDFDERKNRRFSSLPLTVTADRRSTQDVDSSVQ